MEDDRTGLPNNVSLLIYEDSAEMARTLCELLQTYGFAIAGSSTVRTIAEKMAAEQSFDLALITVGRNATDALAFADGIVAKGRKIVFLEGYGEVPALPEHLRDYPRLAKPIEPRELVTSILGALGYAWGS